MNMVIILDVLLQNKENTKTKNKQMRTLSKMFSLW